MTNVTDSLLRTIDRTKLLRQHELNQVFAKSRYLLNDCMVTMSVVCQYPQLWYIEQAMEVVARVDRRRAIYKRPAPTPGYEINYERDHSNAKLSCHAMDMMAAIKRDDLVKQQHLLATNELTRAVFEKCIETWLALCKSYEGYMQQYADAWSADNQLEQDKAELQMALFETQLGTTRPEMLGGVIRYVKRRFKAVYKLYGQVQEAYSRVVLKIAHRYAGSEAQANDSFQNGNFGLRRAVRSYDHCSRAGFSSYASMWTKQAILFHLKDGANMIRVQPNLWQQHNALQRQRWTLESKLGPLTNEELASRLGLKRQWVSNIYAAIQATQIRSLDKPLTEDDQTTFSLASTVVDPSLAENEEHEEQHERLKHLFQELTPNECLVICLRYGTLSLVPQELSLDFEQSTEVERLRQRAHKLNTP